MASLFDVSRFQDRIEQLGATVERATAGLAELPDETRQDGDQEALARLEHTLAYTGLVLASTEGELATEAVFQALTLAVDQIVADPVAAHANSINLADDLLNAVGQLPAARGLDAAQAAREAAATYQRSVQQRVHALRVECDGLRSKIGEIETAGVSVRNGLKSALDQSANEFDTRLTEFQQTLATERSLLDDTKTSQAEVFRQAQAKRDETFEGTLTTAKAEVEKLLAEAGKLVADRVAEIERMENESSALVGAIGLAGTAERYGEEVKDQRSSADKWRWYTVCFVVAAVGGVLFVVLSLGDDPRWEEVLGKLAASLLFGGLATYAARQSARHRHREEGARALQLELTAFGPFIEPLTSEQQEEERVVMTRKTFGKAASGGAVAEEEPGPTALSYLLRRKEKEGK